MRVDGVSDCRQIFIDYNNIILFGVAFRNVFVIFQHFDASAKQTKTINLMQKMLKFDLMIENGTDTIPLTRVFATASLLHDSISPDKMLKINVNLLVPEMRLAGWLLVNCEYIQ